MNFSTHSHGLSTLHQLGNACIGLFFTAFGFGLAVISLPSILSGQESIFTVFSNLIGIIVMFSIGSLFFAIPLFTRIEVAPDIVKFYTPALIVAAKWQDIQHFERQKSGTTYLVVVPTKGVVTLRFWAKPIRRLFRDDPSSFFIDTSHFRASNGHSLESDIIAFSSLAQ